MARSPATRGIEQPAAHKGPAARLRHKPGHRQAPQREPENVMSAENEIREIVSRYTRAADWRDGEALAKLYEAAIDRNHPRLTTS